MKKRFLFKAIVVTVIAVALSGCSKDKDSDVKVDKGIENTVWIENRGASNLIVSFYKTDAVLALESTVIDSRITTTYKYGFVSPKVTMFPDDTGNAILEGVVKGDLMTLTNTSKNEVVGILKKQ